jgi:hypothetical protein
MILIPDQEREPEDKSAVASRLTKGQDQIVRSAIGAAARPGCS